MLVSNLEILPSFSLKLIALVIPAIRTLNIIKIEIET
jgi:hypothetical protein